MVDLSMTQADQRAEIPTTTAHPPAAMVEALVKSVRPLIERRLRQRGLRDEDLEDLAAEAVRRLMEAFCAGEDAEETRARDSQAYALAVADSVFADHLRRTRPNWYRLKRRVLYLLDGKAGGDLFARWRCRPRPEWLGGFLAWRGRPFRPTARHRELCQRKR